MEEAEAIEEGERDINKLLFWNIGAEEGGRT